MWPQVDSALEDILKPHLNELLLELAWVHGWKTWYEVRRRIRKSDENMKLPADADKLLLLIKGFAPGNSPAP